MLKTQEPKYDFTPAGKLYNRTSGHVIPDDEPVMIFRAKDRNAVSAIEFYIDACENEEHQTIVRGRLDDFKRFAAENPDRMHEPD